MVLANCDATGDVQGVDRKARSQKSDGIMSNERLRRKGVVKSNFQDPLSVEPRPVV